MEGIPDRESFGLFIDQCFQFLAHTIGGETGHAKRFVPVEVHLLQQRGRGELSRARQCRRVLSRIGGHQDAFHEKFLGGGQTNPTEWGLQLSHRRASQTLEVTQQIHEHTGNLPAPGAPFRAEPTHHLLAFAERQIPAAVAAQINVPRKVGPLGIKLDGRPAHDHGLHAGFPKHPRTQRGDLEIPDRRIPLLPNAAE